MAATMAVLWVNYWAEKMAENLAALKAACLVAHWADSTAAYWAD